MEPKIPITTYADVEQVEWIAEQKEERDTSKSHIVREALRFYRYEQVEQVQADG